MTLLKLFNASNANSPKDDAGGFNAQLKSKGRDQSPSPPKDDVDFDSTEAATPEGKSSVSFLRSKQETLIVANNRGKAGKEPSLLCDSPIKCGHTVTGKDKLSFLEDVVCTEPPVNEDDCAITVSGEGAELDCNHFMISQETSGSWKYGICVSNGAKAMNCPVERFGVGRAGFEVGAGIRIEDGGEIEDCEVMFNVNHGIEVSGSQDSTSTTKISDTFIHNNGRDGIWSQGKTGSESSIQIEGVRSINNGSNGMFFNVYGDATMNLRVKDSETSYNGFTGFYSTGSIDFELEGFFNSRYNGGNGMSFFYFSEGEIKVKGDVNLYKNKNNGLSMLDRANVNVVVDKRGALNSCSNDQSESGYEDIYNKGSGTFSGVGYTCGTEGNSGTGPSGFNVPVCKACPSCPSE